MTKENNDALNLLSDTIDKVAKNTVDDASFDKTRNARITKVYEAYFDGAFSIVGYDIEVDGKSYYIKKQRGKGINAKENDIVKLHIPCNNMSAMYLSYPHDAEDIITKYDIDFLHPTENTRYTSYTAEYNSGVKIMDMYCTSYMTFPATTKQFSSDILDVPIFQLEGIPDITKDYTKSFLVTAEDGILASVDKILSSPFPAVRIKLYNENPDTINPVVKVCKMHIHGVIIPYYSY